jgi:hypothetical protein
MPIHAKTTIMTDSGEPAEAIAPIIVSASRATDIPGFFGRWFMKRLDAGYVRWVNPWNGRPSFVSLHQARLIVFWTKNPAPFLPYLKDLDARGLHYYFHFTVNDYEPEGLEPGVPPLRERIATFRRLADAIGPHRVLWRFDPLVTTDTLSPRELLRRIRAIGDDLAGFTERLTMSFMTGYAKAKRNLASAKVHAAAWSDTEKIALLPHLADCLSGWNIEGVTCAEPANNGSSGIGQGKCVDDVLARRLWGDDARLSGFLTACNGAKDSGQRQGCRCIPSKDIGRYDTCRHGCRYCYATAASRERASGSTPAAGDGDVITL